MPSDREIVIWVTVACLAWTFVLLGAGLTVFQRAKDNVQVSAGLQAEAAVGRIRDVLATLTRTSSSTTPGDTGIAENCPRLRAIMAAPQVPGQVGYTAQLFLGPCCYPDGWVTTSINEMVAGQGERSLLRTSGSQPTYQLLTALPVERCKGCHPSRATFPTVLVQVPLRTIASAEWARETPSFIGFGIAWIVGLGIVTQTTIGLRRAGDNLRRLKDDHMSFFDTSTNAGFLVSETPDGLLGPILRANARAAQELGRSVESLSGVAVTEVLDRMDETTQRTMVRELHLRGRAMLETTLLVPDGRPVPVEAEASVFEYGDAPTVLLHMRDLGDRRTAEHALARRDRRLDLLSSATRKLTEHLDERLVLRELVSSSMRIVDATAGVAGLLVGDSIVLSEAADLDGRRPIDVRVPWDDGLAAHVLRARKPYVSNDALRDPLISHDLVERGESTSVLAVPIPDSSGRMVGLFEVYDQLHGAFSEEDVSALNAVAAAAGVAIENARVVQQLLSTRHQLLDYQTELRQLAEELSAAQERERRRIAVELHDGIGQTLAIMRIKMGQAAQRCADEHGFLAELKGLLEATIAETRSLTFQLSPPILYELGLGPAIEWLCENLDEQNEPHFTFAESGSPQSLNEDARALLYAATRELLLNAVKHAEATNVDATLRWSADEVHIEVSDDGKGLPPQGSERGRGGYGLFGARERLRSLSALLQLSSEPGCGTRACIDVPLPCAPSNQPTS